MIELPKTKVKATRKDPRKLVIFGKPKAGKSTILSELDNCLLVDLESGTEMLDAIKFDVLKYSEANNISILDTIKNLIKKLSDEKVKNGKNTYKYIAIDTITKLEEVALPLAADMYRKQPIGANWAGNDVRKLPNGAGYLYLKEAFFFILEQFNRVCDTLILIGHLKDKMINTDGQDMTEKALDLTGKTSRLVAADADAIGYIYREENRTILNFAPSESLEAGARPDHLKGKQIVIAESDANGKLKVYWDRIFIDK